VTIRDEEVVELLRDEPERRADLLLQLPQGASPRLLPLV